MTALFLITAETPDGENMDMLVEADDREDALDLYEDDGPTSLADVVNVRVWHIHATGERRVLEWHSADGAQYLP